MLRGFIFKSGNKKAISRTFSLMRGSGKRKPEFGLRVFTKGSLMCLMVASVTYAISSCLDQVRISNDTGFHGHDRGSTETVSVVHMKDLSLHNTPEDCWISVHGHVYDVTDFLQQHPGGEAKLLKYAGKDATRGFRLQHPGTYLEKFLDGASYKGELVVPKKESKKKASRADDKLKGESSSMVDSKDDHNWSVHKYYNDIVDEHLKHKQKNRENDRQNGKDTFTLENKPSINQIFSLHDFEYVAQKVLPNLVYTFIQSGADNEFARFENRAALGRIFFRARCLVDVRTLNLGINMGNVLSPLPFLIGSFAGSSLVQERGGTIVSRIAASNNVMQIVSDEGDVSLDDIIAEMDGKDTFYQYSIDSVKALKESTQILNDLKIKYPNIKCIFIDVAKPVNGNLEHYRKLEAYRPKLEEYPAPQLKQENPTPNLCWDDLAKLKNEVDVPIVLKGIERSEDVIKCRELGFTGVLISDHEGKQLDQCLSPIEVLHNVAGQMDVGSGQFDIFVEGGFRRGSDVVKTLCLGGIPVITKPILFSEVYGEAGVQKSLDILKSEICTTMRLIGAKSVDELNREFLDCEGLSFRATSTRNLDAMYDDNYTNPPPPRFTNEDKLVMV